MHTVYSSRVETCYLEQQLVESSIWMTEISYIVTHIMYLAIGIWKKKQFLNQYSFGGQKCILPKLRLSGYSKSPFHSYSYSISYIKVAFTLCIASEFVKIDKQHSTRCCLILQDRTLSVPNRVPKYYQKSAITSLMLWQSRQIFCIPVDYRLKNIIEVRWISGGIQIPIFLGLKLFLN